MAIPWLTVLKTVPWSEVISNAPKVAEGAKKLWKAVAGKPAPAEAARAAPSATPLEARLRALEAARAESDRQMLASSELIQALAEQNAQLIRRIEGNRVHVLWLTAAVVVLAGAVLVLLFR